MVAGTPTRASLLTRLHDGADPMAWNDFFERYWPLVFSIARQRGCSQYTAEDVVPGRDAGGLQEKGRVPPRSVARPVPRLAGGRGAAESYRATARSG